VKALQSLGDILRGVGKLALSQLILEETLTLAKQLQSPQAITENLISLGKTARLQEQSTKALDYYQKAVQESPSPDLIIQAQLSKLELLLAQNNLSEAKILIPEIEYILTKLPPSRAAVYARITLAKNIMKKRTGVAHSHNEASENYLQFPIHNHLATAIKLAHNLGDKRAKSNAMGILGNLYEQHQRLDEARELTEGALLLAETINAPDLAYQWQWQLGRILKVQGNRKGAIASYTKSVKTLKSLRGDLVAISSEVQFSFRESVEPVYRELVELLLQPPAQGEVTQENLKQAREVIESLQLAELDNFFRDACLDTQPVEIDKLDQKAAIFYPIILEKRLEIVVSLPNTSKNKRSNPKNATILKHKTISAAEFEQNTFSDLRTVIAPSIVNPQRSSRELEDRTRDNLATIQEIAKRRGIGVTPIDGNIILAERQKLYKDIAGQVYDWVIRPFEKEIKASEVETLVFVLDTALLNLPMSVLYDNQEGKFLLEKYAIAITPGLQLIDSKQLVRGKLNAFKAGISQAVDFEYKNQKQSFSELPNVKNELEAIEQQVPGGIIINDKFTTTAIEGTIRSIPFPVVHLATHGQFSSDPEDTFILTWKDRLNVNQINTLLQLREEVGTNALELLVLSACETATGDKRAALGLAGVAVRSGARSTLATLWQVDDKGTAELMIEFYKQLKDTKITKAEALRRAQMALMAKDNKYKQPYYWAPFILVGNWL
ncbi:MAG: CHAT domain-containing protein, partial [Moorea sp. SIO2B7]|nr:CHAT domain-containing protein [Moorena sp. SIO2B7]